MRLQIPEGFEVRISHTRRATNGDIYAPAELLRKIGMTISPRGGRTVAHLVKNGEIVVSGVAKCGPRDNFNRRIGRDIAIGRALKELEARSA